MVSEAKVIQTIVLGSDWQDVLTTLIQEEEMDPADVDLIKLTDAFVVYIERLKKFDFRIPARFVLVAAILLRMKCELLLEEEEKKAVAQKDVEPLNIENIPPLAPPLVRKPTRKVTLEDLISALNKAFAFKERKEVKQIRMRHAVEKLIEKEEDIEDQIRRIHNEIYSKRSLDFSDLVPVWKRVPIIKAFIPVLHLIQRNEIEAEQEGMFKEIHIRVKEKEHEKEQAGTA